jgi:hypothetical protein
MSEIIYEYQILNNEDKSFPAYLFRLKLHLLDAIEVREYKRGALDILQITVFFNGNQRELHYSNREDFNKDVNLFNEQLNKTYKDE